MIESLILLETQKSEALKTRRSGFIADVHCVVEVRYLKTFFLKCMVRLGKVNDGYVLIPF